LGLRRTRTRRYVLLKNAVKSVLPCPESKWAVPVDDRANTPRGEGVRLDWPDGVPKPHIGLVRDTDAFPYWTRYLRFLETNDILPGKPGVLSASSPDGTVTVQIGERVVGIGAFAGSRILVRAS
jgi:hypothetical protein